MSRIFDDLFILVDQKRFAEIEVAKILCCLLITTYCLLWEVHHQVQ